MWGMSLVGKWDFSAEGPRQFGCFDDELGRLNVYL